MILNPFRWWKRREAERKASLAFYRSLSESFRVMNEVFAEYRRVESEQRVAVSRTLDESFHPEGTGFLGAPSSGH